MAEHRLIAPTAPVCRWLTHADMADALVLDKIVALYNKCLEKEGGTGPVHPYSSDKFLEAVVCPGLAAENTGGESFFINLILDEEVVGFLAARTFAPPVDRLQAELPEGEYLYMYGLACVDPQLGSTIRMVLPIARATRAQYVCCFVLRGGVMHRRGIYRKRGWKEVETYPAGENPFLFNYISINNLIKGGERNDVT